jgi:hypothetical protein
MRAARQAVRCLSSDYKKVRSSCSASSSARRADMALLQVYQGEGKLYTIALDQRLQSCCSLIHHFSPTTLAIDRGHHFAVRLRPSRPPHRLRATSMLPLSRSFVRPGA